MHSHCIEVRHRCTQEISGKAVFVISADEVMLGPNPDPDHAIAMALSRILVLTLGRVTRARYLYCQNRTSLMSLGGLVLKVKNEFKTKVYTIGLDTRITISAVIYIYSGPSPGLGTNLPSELTLQPILTILLSDDIIILA